eukprot:GFUD01138056.1.p1 GENE.GFUD01138056.1~~GFUD01138056.1.p1  ORF type:complete len:392 (-),score=136.30 GFUD01138056.1:36-1211(-)
MDTQLVNCLVYDYMATVDTKLAEKFKKEAKVTQQLPPGSPGIVDIFKHFKETSTKEMKRKHAIAEEESSTKKAKQNLSPDSSKASVKIVEDSECGTEEVEVKAATENVYKANLESQGNSVLAERTKIFIRNVSKEVVYEDFQTKVEQFGKVTDFVNPGRGFCFLTFSSAEAANACIDALNNSEIAGKTVQMNITRKKSEAGPTGKDASENVDGCKLFVHGVKQETGNDELKEAFAKFGKVIDAFNPGKGFAFVTFSSPEEATAGAEALNGKEVCGNCVSVNVSKPKVKLVADSKSKAEKKSKKREVLESFRLFVNNVSEETTQDDLKSAFAAHGTVTDAYNPGKGFAFVNFASADEAQAAIDALNGKEVCGKEIECNLAKFKKVQKGRGKS